MSRKLTFDRESIHTPGAIVVNTILTDQNLTATILAKLSRVSKTTLYNLIYGKTITMSDSIASKIKARFPQYSFEWLITGAGPKLISTLPSSAMGTQPDLIRELYEMQEALKKTQDENFRLQRIIGSLLERMTTIQS